jgi:hypothetical protein
MLWIVLLSQWYWPRSVAYCREQNFYALWYWLWAYCILCGLLACWEKGTECSGLWLLIRGGTELLEVLGMEGQDIRRYPGAR